MSGREGEGKDDEVSERPEETLEDFRKEIMKKHDWEKGKKDGSNGQGKDEADEPREQGNSGGNGSGETAPKIESEGETYRRNTEGRQQKDSQDIQETQPESTGKHAGREVARLEEPPPPDRATGENELEAMRKYLNEMYPDDEKDAAGDDGTRPATPLDRDKTEKTGMPEQKPGESSEEQVAERRQGTATAEMETSPKDSVAAKEDVGWETPSGRLARAGDGVDDKVNLKVSAQTDLPAEAKSQRAGVAGAVEATPKNEKPPLEGQSRSQGKAEVKGGGNQHPEHDRPMLTKDGSPSSPKGGSNEGREGDDRQPIVRKASAYMDSLALIIPDRVIPKHEDRDDVFEVRVSRVSKPEEEYSVYMPHSPGYERAYLPIRHVGAEKGEEFLVKPPERYEGVDFARDYNVNEPKGLENTSLGWRDGKFVLKVDDTELELKESTLRAQEGKAVLDAKLNDEDKNAVKIAKGVDGFDFRFKTDHAIITSVKESREGVTISYRRTRHDEFPHVRLVGVERHQPMEGEKLESWKHEVKLDVEGVRLEKHIESLKDAIKIELSETNRKKAWEYLEFCNVIR